MGIGRAARRGVPARALADGDGGPTGTSGAVTFDDAFSAEFAARFAPLYRYLARVSGDPALAADVAQDAFARLYERGSMPNDVGGWLAAVANNLVRTHHRRLTRRFRLLSRERSTHVLGDPAPSPAAAAEQAETRARVRAALDALDLRDRQILLLRVEGHSYREVAVATGVAETSVGTLLARAKVAFRRALGNADDPCE